MPYEEVNRSKNNCKTLLFFTENQIRLRGRGRAGLYRKLSVSDTRTYSVITSMTRDYFLQLTQAVYRVTELFPVQEPLKFKLKEKAVDIFANLVLLYPENPGPNQKSDQKILEVLKDDLKILDSYFELAVSQAWVDPLNFEVLKKEYKKIEKELKGLKNLTKAAAETPLEAQIQAGPEVSLPIIELEEKIEEKPAPQSLTNFKPENRSSEINKSSHNSRQEKILEVLKEKEKIQVWEVKKVFPEVSKRTLRRDFEDLLKQDLIERIGEKNNTFYCLKTNP